VRDLRRLPLFALVLALGVAFGVPSALGQSVWEQQQSLDSKIAGLQSEISRAKHKEGVLTTEISSSSSQISSLQGDIGALTAIEPTVTGSGTNAVTVGTVSSTGYTVTAASATGRSFNIVRAGGGFAGAVGDCGPSGTRWPALSVRLDDSPRYPSSATLTV